MWLDFSPKLAPKGHRIKEYKIKNLKIVEIILKVQNVLEMLSFLFLKTFLYLVTEKNTHLPFTLTIFCSFGNW
jgi:aminopeptidase-like protein